MRIAEGQLTKRQVNNLRAIWMTKARMMGDKLIASVIGEPAQIACECGAVHDVPGTGEALAPSQVGAAKIMFAKVFPDIAAEDFEASLKEPQDADDQAKTLADAIGDMALMHMVIQKHPEQAIKARDFLIERTQGIEPMRKTG